MLNKAVFIPGAHEAVWVVGIGSGRVCPSHDRPMAVYDLGETHNRALGTAERPQVDEFVVMVIVVVVLWFALRTEPNRDRQRGEYGHCGKAHQESGFHVASSYCFSL